MSEVCFTQILRMAENRLAKCSEFVAVNNLIRTCAYINLEAVMNPLSDAVDLFALSADFTNEAELTALVSVTDPRIICLAAGRIATLRDFVESSKAESVPLPMTFPFYYPIRSALVDAWRSYCRIADGFDN